MDSHTFQSPSSDGRKIIDALRLLAIYLPQFHPIPENDLWWAKGFTEWANVAKAKPLFKGHYQPHIPADLGFYDLRVPETRIQQADLARAHGIHGFCYYHYWFAGRQLLDRPFKEILESGEPDFPFSLCWANESWGRGWQGADKDLLIEQTYSEADHRQHARWLIRATDDRRYIRVHGRPLFLVYRPTHMPDPLQMTEIFREEFALAGLPEPFLVGVSSFKRDKDMRELGFDLTMNFMPDFFKLPLCTFDWYSKRRVLQNLKFGTTNGHLRIYDYAEAIELMTKSPPAMDHLPSVLVGWDNSPRRGDRSVVMVGNTADRFEAHLRKTVHEVKHRHPDERIVFLNAWNEWGEGNHLEPDQRNGLAFLQAVKKIADESRAPASTALP